MKGLVSVYAQAPDIIKRENICPDTIFMFFVYALSP